jgi:hypothetical protein
MASELRVVQDGDTYKFFNLELGVGGEIISYDPTTIEIPVGEFATKPEYVTFFGECVIAIGKPILDLGTVLTEYFTNQAVDITWNDVFDSRKGTWPSVETLVDFVVKYTGYQYVAYKNDYIYYVDEVGNYYKLNKTVDDLDTFGESDE